MHALHARVAALTRHRPANDPELVEARTEWEAASAVSRMREALAALPERADLPPLYRAEVAEMLRDLRRRVSS